MRIALYADGRSPHTERWANAVADRGHDVAVVWFAHELVGADTSRFRPAVTHHPYEPPSPIRPWQWPNATRQWRRLARETRADLAHGLSLVGYGWAAAEGGVRPLVLTALGSDVFRLERVGEGSVVQRLAEVYAVRRTRAAVGAAAVVLTDSAFLADAVRRSAPGTETRIVRFGVETGTGVPEARAAWRRELAIEDDATVILSSRLVRAHYNIDTIVRALPLIRDELPRAVLVLKELPEYSEPEYRTSCLALADALGVRDAIRLVGALSRQDLLELHTAADVYVSIPTTDGTAVSVLEAMAAGVPVVASDVPGIDPVFLEDEQTAILVPPREPESVASAVVRLSTQPQLREAMTERARLVVERNANFDLELDRAVLLYEQLVSSRVRSRTERVRLEG